MAGQQQTSTKDPEYTKTRIELAVKDFTHETHKTIKAAAKTHKASRSPTGNAHCTIACHHITALIKQLANKPRENRESPRKLRLGL